MKKLITRRINMKVKINPSVITILVEVAFSVLQAIINKKMQSKGARL